MWQDLLNYSLTEDIKELEIFSFGENKTPEDIEQEQIEEELYQLINNIRS